MAVGGSTEARMHQCEPVARVGASNGTSKRVYKTRIAQAQNMGGLHREAGLARLAVAAEASCLGVGIGGEDEGEARCGNGASVQCCLELGPK